jgi:hypothetical protein
MDGKIMKIEGMIAETRVKLAKMGNFRPGTLTRQYGDPARKKRPYYQISYTYRMRSRTEYVRGCSYARIKKETSTYKVFRKLVEKWIDLEMQLSKLRSELEKDA